MPNGIPIPGCVPILGQTPQAVINLQTPQGVMQIKCSQFEFILFQTLMQQQQMLAQIVATQEKIMADQDTLTTYAAAVEAAVGVIAQEIADLKAANPQLDWTAADKALTDLQALEPAQPAPSGPTGPTGP